MDNSTAQESDPFLNGELLSNLSARLKKEELVQEKHLPCFSTRSLLSTLLAFLFGASLGALMAALVYHTNLPSVPEGYIRKDKTAQSLCPCHNTNIHVAPDGTITEVWWENKTFAQSPNILSEQAWDELVPVGKGFIHHPELAPFISNLAVFHQLHCLVSIPFHTVNLSECPLTADG